LLSSTPLHCNSTQLADPSTLTVRIPSSDLQISHQYRYCVVLLESRRHADDVKLVLGCSEIIQLHVTIQSQAQPARNPSPTPTPRISSVTANLTSDTLSVAVALWDVVHDPHCRIIVTVLAAASLAAQHHVNCSFPRLTVSGLPPGPYHVCATMGAHPPEEPRVSCIPVPLAGKAPPNVALIAGFAVAFAILVAILCLVGRFVRRPRIIATHQCFLAAPENDDVAQHARYVKLQATTKL